MNEHRHLCGTVAEVALELRCSENHVRHLIATGRLPVNRLGRRTVIYWHRLEAWLDNDAERSIAAPPPPDQLSEKRRLA